MSPLSRLSIPRFRRSRRMAGAIALGLSALTAVTALAACGSAPTAGGPSGGQSITYLYFTNGPDLQATKKLIGEFEQQTGATVTLDTIPYANEEETVQGQLNAGDPPAVMETTAASLYVNDLVDLGKVLGPSWAKSLDPAQVSAVTYNGAVVGLPDQRTVMAPLVNVDMFSKAGVPLPHANMTWPQLVSAAERVQAANHTKFAFAIDHSGTRVANILAQYGVFLFGKDGHTPMGAADTAAATKGISQLVNLISSNEISKAAWIAAGTKYAPGDTQFLAEQAPVLLSGSWEVASFANTVPFKWTAVPNPCAVNCGGGSGGNYMVAFKKSNNPKLAAQFIKFMSEPANQSYMSTQADTIPSSASLTKPGAIHYPAAVARTMQVFNKESTLMPASFVLSESNPGFTAVSNVLENEISLVVSGKATVAQAVAATEAAAKADNDKAS